MPQHQTEKKATFTQKVMNRFHEVNELYDGTLHKVHYILYATDISSNDSFTFRNAVKQDDKLALVDSDHKRGGNWSIVHCDTLLNKAQHIKAIWSFKQKRKLYGEKLNHNARLCAHCGMQQWDDNYWETYSPLVNMLSVRLILAIPKLHNLDSEAIDFVIAFLQENLEEDIWMYLPIGFQVDGHTEASSERSFLLKLNKKLYGLKQGSYNWY